MLVSENNIFPSLNMRIRITGMDGVDLIVEITPNLTVDKVKIMCLGRIYTPEESMKLSLYHKLVLVRTARLLNEDSTVEKEGVLDNDELLLLKRRLPPSPFDGLDKSVKDESKRGPTVEEIHKVTAGLPKPDKDTQIDTPSTAADFPTEMRKILISLIEASQKILCLNPEAVKIFTQAEDILNEPVEKKIDNQALKQLTDMGFETARAKKALILNKMSVVSAMEWLFQHESDPDIDSPLRGMEENTEEHGAVGGEEKADDDKKSVKVTNILESLRAFRKRGFRPNPRALHNLLEMGFEEKDAIDALRVSRNDQDGACDWLLGDRFPRPEEMDEGLDPEGAVYQAIMANPTIQLGLNNPRCLLAFIQMLDNPMAASRWLNDPATGPMLIQISRIYHAEKHSTKASSSFAPSMSLYVSQPPSGS